MFVLVVSLGLIDGGIRKFIYCLGFLLDARQDKHGIDF